MKIGIYGGSFNPIHNGHIYIAKYILKYLELDKLIIVPLGNPSHKENQLLDGQLRLKLCELAFKSENKIEVSGIEINSKEPSYTYDTLLKIIKLYPNSEYFEVIGEDSGAYFQKWKNYKKILKLSKVVIFQREGYKTTLKDSNIIHVKNKFLNFSSTAIREVIKSQKSIAKMVPKDVERFIKSNRLYE